MEQSIFSWTVFSGSHSSMFILRSDNPVCTVALNTAVMLNVSIKNYVENTVAVLDF